MGPKDSMGYSRVTMNLRRREFLRAILAAWLLTGCGESGDDARSVGVFPVSRVVVETATGSATFEVEVATTPAQHAQGLQGRRSLAENAGMLFDFQEPERVVMWMKDTYVPLDMIFIDEEGRIVAIAENTVPESLDAIDPGETILAVLEVNAGTAARFGLSPGDRVRHPIFERSSR